MIGDKRCYCDTCQQIRWTDLITQRIVLEVPLNKIRQIHDVHRRWHSRFRPPKQAFISLFTYIGPSCLRSAIQKLLLAHFLEVILCRIQPNGALYEVLKNPCAGIPRIWHLVVAGALIPEGGLRRRNKFRAMQVSHDSGRSGTLTGIHRYPEDPYYSGLIYAPVCQSGDPVFFSRGTGVHQLSKVVEMGVFLEKGRLYPEIALLFSRV